MTTKELLRLAYNQLTTNPNTSSSDMATLDLYIRNMSDHQPPPPTLTIGTPYIAVPFNSDLLLKTSLNARGYPTLQEANEEAKNVLDTGQKDCIVIYCASHLIKRKVSPIETIRISTT